MFRRFPSTLLVLAAALAASTALGAPRDKAANEKIDQAINQHYLSTEFEKAEALLLGTVQACEDKCSPAVKAKAWMYVGLVRGCGRDDQAGALEAFKQALAVDPNVTLDEALATPATKETFGRAKQAGGGTSAAATSGAPAPSATPAVPAEAPPAAASAAPSATPAATPAGTMQCTPFVREVETRRPIPFSCAGPASATKGIVYYQEANSPTWNTVPMAKKGTMVQGTVPCAATTNPGKLKLYIEARDAQGAVVDSMGSAAAPVEFTLVPQSSQAPPSLPGEPPPARCEEDLCANAPPDFPGCEKSGTKEWGDSCAANDECKSLLCKAGTCDSCNSDSDCSAGKCVEGSCSLPGSKAAPGRTGKKVWIGLHIAGDIGLLGADDVCSPKSQNELGYACYYRNTEEPYIWAPVPGKADKISSGAAYATTRLLVSMDYALTPRLTLGGRLGFAFGGGPRTWDNKSFFPLHAEARLAYWFVPLDKRGLRPYVHAGGGIAQVDTRTKVGIYDCAGPVSSSSPRLTSNTGEVFDACKAGTRPEVATGRYVDVYRKMGLGFATLGGGFQYALTERMALQGNLNVMVMLPIVGFVLEPSIGGVVGF